VTDSRVVLRALEHPPKLGESSSAQAERILYFTLMSAIDAGLIRTMEDALKVMRHSSQPLGPMGAEWLERAHTSPGEREWTRRPGLGKRRFEHRHAVTSDLPITLSTGDPS